MSLGEILSVQRPLVDALAGIGWAHVEGEDLPRADENYFIPSEVERALERLNPAIAEDPSRVHEITQKLHLLPLTAQDTGLVEANRAFADWLKGEITHEYVGTKGSVPVTLIDFENPANNTYIVSDEVRYGTPGKISRFDIVLWVNGFPLVVGELKTPVNRKVSWVKGATELTDVYQAGWAPFFVSNVLCFATEGKEYRYAGVGTPVQHWHAWGGLKETPNLQTVISAATSQLTPANVLDYLADLTTFENAQADDGVSSVHKLLARYTQFEAVNLIVDRVKDPDRKKGLIYHTQGSGKTLAMVFAAGKLLRDPELENPTIVLVADRVQLVSQLWDQFRTTSMPRLLVPDSAAELRRLLKDDRRGLIFTTVHKFKGAGVLSTRENIVVMVDEAHRTQEGDLGQTMRASLPNANLFAFTGTPIANMDRNTFKTFGDDSDPGSALHTYGTDEAIRDGMTVPIHVSPRQVDFNLDKEALDEAFAVMAQDENLDDAEQDRLARRASRATTFFLNPERVKKVCADMVDHFYDTVDPLGMKAQVVVIDRAACVAYVEEIDRLLQARYEAQLAAGDEHADAPQRDEVAVVMTVGTAKGEDPSWQKYNLTDAEEAALLKRFRAYGDPLKFLVCTSKLGTGFNAPIEGVMYLDKPLKEHTLFQTITRANRTWRNPETGADKRYGIIVDYVGLGAGFARAMAPADPDKAAPEIEVDGLVGTFESQLEATLARFSGIDVNQQGPQTLMDAQARMPGVAEQQAFAVDYAMLEGIWESLWPHHDLRPHRAEYRFVSQVYASLQPSTGHEDHLWHRLGVKTLQLVHDHMGDIRVTRADEVVVADADTVKTLLEEGLIDEPKEVEGKTAEQIIDSIAERLKARMAKDGNAEKPQFVELSVRLDRLRKKQLQAAQESIEWLREAFTLAKDLKAVEKADDEGTLDLLPDPRIGALTQIFLEYAPKDAPLLVENVVKQIDEIVREVSYEGWYATQEGDRLVRRHVREVLHKHQLHKTKGLFNRAYEYIAEHY
ncbi:type I restriction endonuclease subunit R [Micrococcus sp. FDAARGOS_333]|uniref:type I restriction endonuclease subunit R n=1 Tax=Micrococcus sp. FDAARGOS_333 TaxID=1930558 RepID=UPI000B4E40D8|nr:HsdR family type I site-specific deoxyribonuclease [Micrococcus sp. FDAARGOS_333]PNL18005.1 type I restriction endonuclease subunit R [Micrococcus sp. FDAARGOS_333]